MYYLEPTQLFVLSYATWAVVLSDSRFHRVWSVALFLLRSLIRQLFDQPFSISSVPLAMLVLFVFIVCIILSPAQILLFNTKPIGPKKKALETYIPKNEALASVEFVIPACNLDISTSDLKLSSLASLPFTVLQRIQKRHGCLDYQATTSLRAVIRLCGCGTFYQRNRI